MIILDTDHTSILQYEGSDVAMRLTARLNSDPQENFATTVITPEEQMRGWLAAISGRKNVQEQNPILRRIIETFVILHTLDRLSI
jgi:tRNA(fMet)-specific endonuclease VapC